MKYESMTNIETMGHAVPRSETENLCRSSFFTMNVVWFRVQIIHLLVTLGSRIWIFLAENFRNISDVFRSVPILIYSDAFLFIHVYIHVFINKYSILLFLS